MIEFQHMARGMTIALPLVPRTDREWQPQIVDYETRQERPGPWLVEGPATVGDYRPILQRQGIGREAHRRFADLRTMPQMRAFANRYGLLGVKQARLGLRGRAEHYETWQRETCQMAALLALWDLVRAERRDLLRPFVWWSKEPLLVGVRFGWPMAARSPKLLPISLPAWREPVIMADDQQRPILCFAEMVNGEDGWGEELVRQWDSADPLGPVGWYVRRAVTEQLRGHVHPTLLPDAPGIWWQPDSLLTTLYLMFAREIAYPADQEREMRECAWCGEQFPASGKRKYCAGRKCRNARYHDQKKRAEGQTTLSSV